MTLPLTPQTLAAAYMYLRATPPFKGWKLPPAELIAFHVTRHHDREGDHDIKRDRHIIRVSERKIGSTDALMQVVAHEMIHAYEDGVLHNAAGAHGAQFHRLARRVCRYHGWDSKRFV